MDQRNQFIADDLRKTLQVGNVAGFPLYAGVAARADERKKLNASRNLTPERAQ